MQRKRQGIVNSTKLPFLHFEGKDLSKFRRIPAEFRHLEEKARKRKGKETDRRFLNHSNKQLLLLFASFSFSSIEIYYANRFLRFFSASNGSGKRREIRFLPASNGLVGLVCGSERRRMDVCVSALMKIQ